MLVKSPLKGVWQTHYCSLQDTLLCGLYHLVIINDRLVFILIILTILKYNDIFLGELFVLLKIFGTLATIDFSSARCLRLYQGYFDLIFVQWEEV